MNGGGVKDAEAFASGEVAYLLNGSTSEGDLTWHQNLDNGQTVDSYPVLDSSHGTVYYIEETCPPTATTQTAILPRSSAWTSPGEN